MKVIAWDKNFDGNRNNCADAEDAELRAILFVAARKMHTFAPTRKPVALETLV